MSVMRKYPRRTSEGMPSGNLSSPLPRTSEEIASFEGSPRDFKTAKEPGKTIGSNHVLRERRKEKFLIIKVVEKRPKAEVFFVACEGLTDAM